jgi:hypothetical protein
MKDKEISIILEFNEKDKIDLSKINLDKLKVFGDVKTFKKDDHIEVIVIQSKKQPHLYLISKESVSGNNLSDKFSSVFKKEIEKLAKETLIQLGFNGDEFKKKSVYIEFKSTYSIRDKIISTEFKEKIEKLLVEEGYNIPDYICLKLALSKHRHMENNKDIFVKTATRNLLKEQDFIE